MRLPFVEAATLVLPGALNGAWRRWEGSAALAAAETALKPDLMLAPGAPVDATTFLAEHGAVGPVQPIGCHFLTDVTFSGVLYPFHGDELIDDGSHLSMVSADWLSRFPMHRPGGRVETRRRVISSPVLPVAGPGHRTYGHWIIDFLPRLAIARALLQDKFADLKLLMLRDTPAWAFDLLKFFFKIDRNDCLMFDSEFDELLCHQVCYPTFAHSYPFMLHSFIQKFYVSACHDEPGHRRLCVVRRTRASDVRPFDRRAAFEERAIREGFELFDPQHLTISEQATLFRSAAVVIGEYGSALHNSVFLS